MSAKFPLRGWGSFTRHFLQAGTISFFCVFVFCARDTIAVQCSDSGADPGFWIGCSNLLCGGFDLLNVPNLS